MEEALIKKAIARDASAIEALYDRYAPSLLSVCFRYCGNREDAEDILHDGFIKIIQKIQTFRMRNDGSLEAWMRRIMVNTALNFLRDRMKEKSFVDIDPILEKLNHYDEEKIDEEEKYLSMGQEKIMNLICELPAGYRTVFNMYVFEEYGHKEIAELLQFSENTSKSQLSKARVMLRKKLNQMVNVKTLATYEKV
ncbi:MAG: RNA polymerase sigma factor [Bacteroidales bacterium]